MAACRLAVLQNVQVFEACGGSEDYHLIVWLNPALAGEVAESRETSSAFGAKKDSFSAAGPGNLAEHFIVRNAERTAFAFSKRLQHQEIGDCLGHTQARRDGVRVLPRLRRFPAFVEGSNDGRTAARLNRY